MAWLAATPKPPPGSRRAQRDETAPKATRAEAMKARKIVPQMPPNPMPHIVDRLVELGIVEAAGMGTAPISWQTLRAWSEMTGLAVPAWEARLLRRLSIEYVAEGRRAEVETCPPPYQAAITRREIATEADTLRMVLG